MMFSQSSIRYSSNAIDLWHYAGETYAAYMLACLSITENGSLQSLGTFLSAWGSMDAVFQFLNYLSIQFRFDEERENTKKLLSRYNYAPIVNQILTFIGESAFCSLALVELNNTDMTQNAVPDYNFVFSMLYITFAAKAGIDLITSLIELKDLTTRLKSGSLTENQQMTLSNDGYVDGHPRTDFKHSDPGFHGTIPRDKYKDTLREQIHIKRAKALSSACELGGWTALACGNSFGWVGLAAGVSIKVGQMVYSRASIHGLFGEKSAKRENTESLAQPNASLSPQHKRR